HLPGHEVQPAGPRWMPKLGSQEQAHRYLSRRRRPTERQMRSDRCTWLWEQPCKSRIGSPRLGPGGRRSRSPSDRLEPHPLCRSGARARLRFSSTVLISYSRNYCVFCVFNESLNDLVKVVCICPVFCVYLTPIDRRSPFDPIDIAHKDFIKNELLNVLLEMLAIH